MAPEQAKALESSPIAKRSHKKKPAPAIKQPDSFPIFLPTGTKLHYGDNPPLVGIVRADCIVTEPHRIQIPIGESGRWYWNGQCGNCKIISYPTGYKEPVGKLEVMDGLLWDVMRGDGKWKRKGSVEAIDKFDPSDKWGAACVGRPNHIETTSPNFEYRFPFPSAENQFVVDAAPVVKDSLTPPTVKESLLAQPAPRGKGREILPLVIADLCDRRAKGVKTYGEPLKADNGRDALRDAYEEALDLACYLRQAIEEKL